jgi:signal transduction histidine kinase
VDFTNRIAGARPFEALGPPGSAESTTEVQELERSFASLWDRLREAALREREFAANASHELRTPLTRMRLQAERARASAGPAGGCALDDLVAEVDRMVRIADSLLVMSRDVTAGIPAAETVNLADLVAGTCRRVFPGTNEPDLTAPDEALVRADEALLGIAIENLLDNARKFTPRGGLVKLMVWEAAGRVRLAVTSRGSRIAPGDVEQLFERFYRAPDARATQEGHGLGLPLARHIARLHGGDVRFAASADADARFELDLPAWRPSAQGRG